MIDSCNRYIATIQIIKSSIYTWEYHLYYWILDILEFCIAVEIGPFWIIFRWIAVLSINMFSIAGFPSQTAELPEVNLRMPLNKDILPPEWWTCCECMWIPWHEGSGSIMFRLILVERLGRTRLANLAKFCVPFGPQFFHQSYSEASRA